MTQGRFGDGVTWLEAVNKEENLSKLGRIHINPPPPDYRCTCCGRHISELKPFGSPGDPVVGDFSGELLIKTFRPLGPYNEEALKAMEEAQKALPGEEDPLPWFISRYGKEKGEKLYWAAIFCGGADPQWLCRDCIVLDLDEYFARSCKTYLERQKNQVTVDAEPFDKSRALIDPIGNVAELTPSPDKRGDMEPTCAEKEPTLRKEEEEKPGSIQ